ncbi:aminotransferase class I/II-fold pyridoxal phosphate-dependent enzyme [Changchengzhania lutea]|uniref:aminotransferase class I/II-fold pyridoxal phosphate-dependent enzyme n=1 Tax=Changchengzhania lutea TaxID=2049305 RepID=UPI00115D2759|nr:pyridoxal phosphate-dependent aminotransferase family protein [Changchengzhania lutea]
MIPKKLQQKLEERKANNALRYLGTPSNLIDFSSNDYLGFSKSETIFNKTHAFLVGHNMTQNGATGSRLLSGNHTLYPITENIISNFHNSQSALMFNSGYDANIGLFSSVPQRNDVILYDEFAHASIRDGISMSHATAYKFMHNDLEDLERHLVRCRQISKETTMYIVTESVFSMDGDSPDLKALVTISKKHQAHVIIDEAHAVGVFGKNGAGLVQELELEQYIFARIITFGKALGCHGAAILGSEPLKAYLINFARSFIYTTGLPPHSLATIQFAYQELTDTKIRHKLHQNIHYFKSEITKNNIENIFIESHSVIQCCIISGNDLVKSIAKKLQDHQFDVKPIVSPTVPKGKERLRFCLHSYNTKKDISAVLNLLATFIN